MSSGSQGHDVCASGGVLSKGCFGVSKEKWEGGLHQLLSLPAFVDTAGDWQVLVLVGGCAVISVREPTKQRPYLEGGCQLRIYILTLELRGSSCPLESKLSWYGTSHCCKPPLPPAQDRHCEEVQMDCLGPHHPDSTSRLYPLPQPMQPE